jgi:hypothetical protein
VIPRAPGVPTDDDDIMTTAAVEDRQTYDDIVDGDQSESGQPGMGDPTADIISPDPNEGQDGDAVVIDPTTGEPAVDTSRTSKSIDEIAAEVRAVVGSDGQQAQPADAVTSAVADLRDQLAGIGQVQQDSDSSLPVGMLVAVLLAVGTLVAVVTRED